MPIYRLYCLDASRHMVLADWLEADTVEQAIVQARAASRGASKCEIWANDQMVAKLANGRLQRILQD